MLRGRSAVVKGGIKGSKGGIGSEEASDPKSHGVMSLVDD